MVADHLSAAEADAFMLANVKLVERGEWDPRLLGELLRELSIGDLALELDLTGFEPPEIDLAIANLDLGLGEGPDPADEPAPPGLPVSRPGDLWILGEHRLMCGNALEAASYRALMAGELAAMVLTDPPYNVPIAGNVSGLGRVKHGDFAMGSGEMTEGQFTDFLVQAMTLASEVSAPGSLAYWFIDWRHLHEMILASRRVYEKTVNLCVWAKTTAGMGSFYRSAHELILVNRKAGAQHRNNVQFGRFGRDRTNLWSYPGVAGFGRKGEEGDLLALHPTVKPVALLADAILDATVRGDIVLDAFAGSGSLLIAAQKTGRRARAIELDPLYVDAAVRRWQRWTGEEARLEGDDRTFREVGAARAEAVANG